MLEVQDTTGWRKGEKRSISSIVFQQASQDETVREVAVELVEREVGLGMDR